jgi:predicted ribosomally synthesized peptide with SipW-like signal peptide
MKGLQPGGLPARKGVSNLKRIILGVFSIALVIALVAGVTYAYFTDTETEENNQLYAGKVNIDLRGDGTHEILLETTQSFKGGLVPGLYDPKIFEMDVYNQGWGVSTIPVKYRFKSEFVSQSVGGYWELLKVRVRHTYAGTANPSAWPVVYDGLLKDLNVNSIDHAIADYLDPNITHVYYFEYGLDSSAGNIYQGANATFNIVVDATQYNNPGWTE